MNQQSSIEFELAQSKEGGVPLPKGPAIADPTVELTAMVPADDQAELLTNSQEPPSAASESKASVVSDTSIQRTDAGNALADKPLVTDDHNTVISTQLKSHDDPVPGQFNASVEELQARLFGSRVDRQDGKSSLRIGNMDVYEKIGAGGMGAVFRAVDTELSRDVALKVLHPRVSADPALVARFRNEARACAQLNHDNIARVFNAGDHDGVHYIAYEYAAGKTIKELIHERGQLTTAETVNYAIQATLALGHIESAGIIHRDIKPSNIILTNSGRIKVVDLGLARRETEDSIADLTVAGTTLGTFDYLAPEQARDARAADIRSDIYSLGCSIYHMLAGCPPYPDGTAVQKMLDHQGKEPPDIRQKNKLVPKAMAEIVQRMMTTSPEDRYQVPGQLLADLIHLASEMGLRSVPAEGIVWRRVPVTKVRDISGNLFLAGAVAVICITALIMHFLPTSKESGTQLGEIQSWLMAPATTGESDPLTEAEKQQLAAADKNAETRSQAGGDNSSVGSIPTVDPNPPATTQSVTDAESIANGQVVVSKFLVQSSTGTTRYRTLQEAWDIARDGDIIELDFDGPAPEMTTPLPRRAVGQASPRITIRAAKNREPVIPFGVDSEAVSSTSQGRFFELSSDLQLEISGVHFQIDLSEATQLDDWALFDFGGVNRVRMKGCTVDVSNPQQIPLSVFRLRDGGSIDSVGETASVQLENVVVRGSSDLLRLQAQLQCEVVLEQSGFALDGCLIRNLGSAEMLSQGSLKLTMNHCTTITAQSLIVMQDSVLLEDAQPERVLPNVNVVSHSNVFASLQEGGTLVAIRGNVYREELQELLTWYGNNNYYNDRVLVFWAIESGLTDSDLVELDFDTWQSDWNRQRDTQETYPQIFAADVWKSPELLVDRSADLLNKLPVKAFELNSTFFSSSGGGQFSLEKGEQLPGVNAYDLEEFPSVVNASAPIDVEAANDTPSPEE